MTGVTECSIRYYATLNLLKAKEWLRKVCSNPFRKNDRLFHLDLATSEENIKMLQNYNTRYWRKG
ncbi:hypothetical protein J14TS2_38040 [Bacillus sp. J14TS2]|nr:hypothetical protein J14TS2_38040 [Bacillus sp. J14TS2]